MTAHAGGQAAQPACQKTVFAQRLHLLTRLFDINCSTIAQHFGNARGNFSRVIANANDRVCAQLTRVGQHEIKRVFARPLAKVCVERDVSTKDALDAGANVSNDRT